MTMRALLLIALVGCGRIAFDPAHDRALDGQAPTDLPSDSTDPELLIHVSFDVGLVDDARGHAIACQNGCPSIIAGHVGTGSAFYNNGECLEIADAADIHPALYTFALW